MPEYPDVTVYIEALRRRIDGAALEEIRLASPFLLRTFSPAPWDVAGRRVVAIRRIGKRIAIGLENDAWLVIHLMIAGRLHWKPAGAAIPGKRGLAAFDFASGTLILTEAGSKKRASLHIVAGGAALAAFDPGGLEAFEIDRDAFAAALGRENHTLKRTLTDPRLLSGIGNAYSDEILHAARLSPVAMSQSLTPDEAARLFAATKDTLTRWTETLRAEAGDGFPDKVTAFRDAMAVHGRYGKPCPDCGTAVQRIRYASNETNYCPRCQTGGKVLADRALSRLLKKDWPRTIDELEKLKPAR
ncbi:MAG: formamidopyrimidine-DNA glycosylase [Alphaproteobacteria bacterium]|nr:formamidopyrimidine-DNA glycosylase [Alphaproteobacteria bacterium]